MPHAAKNFHSFGRKQKPYYSRWYGEYAWRKRAKQQLDLEPLCAACEKLGRVVLARVADHIVPHRGNRKDFEEGKLQSLCAHHHSVKTSSGQ